MNEKSEIFIQDEKQMKKFAKSFFKRIKGGQLILLCGDLGAGKTTFTRYFCRSAGVKEDITSPTFTIMRQYHTKKVEIVHFDLYRIENSREVQEFGFEEYVYDRKPNQIVLIEWPYNVTNFTYPDCMEVTIEKIDENKRKIILNKRGQA